MVVYIDVVWLLNFCIDGILILLTATILKKRWKWYRVLGATCIGSSIVLFTFTPYSHIMSQPYVKILCSFLMIFVAFGYSRWRVFLQRLFLFYFITFAVGGGL